MLTLAASQDAGARRFYRPELNSLRFLAFALVFFEHAQPVGWVGRYADVGRFGVPVFFLLSAYLICTLLLREQQATGTVQVGAFMIRRILRIWPLYFVALLGSYLLSHTSLGVGMPHHMLLYFLLLMGNVFVGRYGWTNSPASILWSLSIEEQFYLVIPFVAKFLGRQGLRLVCWAALALGVLTLISFDLGDEADKNRVWVNSFVCFQFFALGGLIASGKERALSGKRLPLRGALLVAGLFCFLLASRSDALYSWRLPGPLLQSYAWGAAGTVALFYAFLGISRATSIGDRVPGDDQLWAVCLSRLVS